MTIHFYKESDAYGEFSNFARYPIVTDDVLWYSSEHYFQAMKFPHDRDYQEKIRTTKACCDIKRLGGTRQIKVRLDWEYVKEHDCVTSKVRSISCAEAVIIIDGGEELSGAYRK